MGVKQLISRMLTPGCHKGKTDGTNRSAGKKIAIVGSPNVGKSVLFNNLTKRYVTVSNYPGTTVEVSRGVAKIGDAEFEVIDTPGMYSLMPITEEERVARRILIDAKPDIVLHVIDAKNLERMLSLTLQLIESGFPVILVLNIMDEAEGAGMQIDLELLEAELGIPVVGTVSTTKRGMHKLESRINKYAGAPVPILKDAMIAPLEEAVAKIENLLKEDFDLPKRALALLLLQGDHEMRDTVAEKQADVLGPLDEVIDDTRSRLDHPIEYETAVHRQGLISRLVSGVVRTKHTPVGFREKLSRLMMNPITGLPILILILYLGLYEFVGNLGAGVVVDFLEATVFEGYVTPFLKKVFSALLPWEAARDLFVGEYGVLTLGLRYAIALILPLVTFFFLIFSVLEDTGYLPRLSMLIDRTFKKIGLSGRAVIPMVLGLGCDTMATMVTRTLATRRERVIATMLLALAVPCSAQLGVILALLQGNPGAIFIWIGSVALVFLFVGYLSGKLLPGTKPMFHMEIPPLRWPKLSNVLVKTYVRVKWYFKEILPLFVLASILIWLGQLTGLFDIIIKGLVKPVELMGLPAESAKIFLFGFFRRDYGAAGLYDLNKAQALTGIQLVVASVALTLFLPCIAQFLINVKERGWKTGLAISGFVLLISFGVAVALNQLLTRMGVTL
ncbi:MAG: ferrous iron transport protein B [Planctomycetia bacterium]|nr:ferrous iron transport protein B [Planctomycetia bacterium]